MTLNHIAYFKIEALWWESSLASLIKHWSPNLRTTCFFLIWFRSKEKSVPSNDIKEHINDGNQRVKPSSEIWLIIICCELILLPTITSFTNNTELFLYERRFSCFLFFVFFKGTVWSRSSVTEVPPITGDWLPRPAQPRAPWNARRSVRQGKPSP